MHKETLTISRDALSLLLIILSPPSDYFRTSDSMLLSTHSVRITLIYNVPYQKIPWFNHGRTMGFWVWFYHMVNHVVNHMVTMVKP